MFHQVMKPAVLIFVVLSLLTGVVYPLLVTGVAQLLFPSQANGTLVYENGKPVASALIGQPFDAPRYFWGRPSATSRVPYNAAASSGSNLAPTNPTLLKFVRVRIETLRVADPGNKAPIPVISSPLPAAAWTRTSARLRPSTRLDAWQRLAAWARTRCGS